MEYKSVSTKLSRDEVTLLKAFCEKKGVTPASLIRDLILRELEIPIPHTIAGKNKINYDKANDKFKWCIELDNGEEIEILKNVSPKFLEDLHEIINRGLEERSSFILKKNKDSVPIPSNIIRRK